jgi:hypothetical protein
LQKKQLDDASCACQPTCRACLAQARLSRLAGLHQSLVKTLQLEPQLLNALQVQCRKAT